MIRFRELALRRASKLLFSDASLALHAGRKIGLTGRNGTGKSSLFDLLLGSLGADAGDLELPPAWTIAHVAQETPAESRPALDYVLDGDDELRKLQRQLHEAGSHEGERLAHLHDRLHAIDGYTAEVRATRLLHGLGFAPGEASRPVAEFSGGWRMRLNLARALICRSDLLLLDEPTNHLDLDAVLWLEDWLKRYPGTLLLISHDRDFLDRVVDQVLHIENQRLSLYSGNYSEFERLRAARLAGEAAALKKQQEQIRHLQGFVDRFRAKATKARQAQSRLKTLERMTLIAPAHVDSPFTFGIAQPERLPRPLLKIDEAAAGYGSRRVLTGIEFTLSPGDRVGLLGPNGAGKSTFIRLLAGELAPLAGERLEAKDLKAAYFAQHQLEQLHPEHSALDHLRQRHPAISDQEARNYLGGFGFSGDRALEPVGPYSGGEKARLVLALIIHRQPNLVLLDEPTNHLDLEMREALTEALQDFAGAMVLVSHDRYLLRATCDQLLLVDRGRVAAFDGDLEDYRRWLAKRETTPEDPAQPATQRSAETRREKKRREAEQRRRLQPLKASVEGAEREMGRLSKQQSDIEARLADRELYNPEHKTELARLLEERARVHSKLADAESAWLRAAEELENAAEEQF